VVSLHLFTSGSVDSAECCDMEISDDGASKNDDDYDSDTDEEESLASFCARMSRTLSSSSQEAVPMKNHAGDRRMRVSTQSDREREPCPFCNRHDAHTSAEASLSTRGKKLCTVCDVIV
jgi:hypothetical protein